MGSHLVNNVITIYYLDLIKTQLKYNNVLHVPPEGIPTLALWWGLCGQMIPRAMLAVAYATGSASHARQVKGDDPDEKGYHGPPGWGLGVRLTTPPRK
jgi:hypothetical protein